MAFVMPSSVLISMVIMFAHGFQFQPKQNGVTWRETMKNDRDVSYFGSIEVGGQKLDGVYDTGSIELVVLSERCGLLCGSGRRQLYDPKLSLSHESGSYHTVLSYGSGTLMAQNAYNTVSMGPYTSSAEAPFWEVRDALMPLLFFSGFEAIVGLGPVPQNIQNLRPHASLANKKAYAVFLKSLGLLRTKYSVCLGKVPKSPGYMIWEDDAVDKMGSLFTPLDVHHGHYWMTKLSDVRLGQTPIACQHGACGGILDSGTSLIAMPTAVAGLLKLEVQKLGSPCSSRLLPSLNFKLNGIDYSLPPDAYMGKVTGQSSSDMMEFFHADGTEECKVSVMNTDMTSDLGSTWILGMPFFRTYYTTFAQRPPKMYTAVASGECTPASGADGSLSSYPLQELREINASALRVPFWVRQAHAHGSLKNSFTVLGRHLAQNESVSLYDSENLQAEISSTGAANID